MASSLVEFSNSLAEAVERAGTSVVGVLEGGRAGVSGTVWREGLAVTAEHTIRGRDEVTLVLPTGEQTKAAVTGRDPGTDLAVLKVSSPLRAATIADDAQARVGEVVLAVGRRGAEGLATTAGIVSAITGPWRTWQGGRVDRFFRLDLNPFTGFSGGPIVNARGEVLGIATSGPRRSVMTIPASTVTRVIDQLAQHGRVRRGHLGIAAQPVAFPENARAGLGGQFERGLLVVTVLPDSPAERAGLLLGDIIVGLDGAPVRGLGSLQPALDSENVGKAITLDVIRGGQRSKVQLTVAERAGR